MWKIICTIVHMKLKGSTRKGKAGKVLFKKGYNVPIRACPLSKMTGGRSLCVSARVKGASYIRYITEMRIQP